MMKDLAIKIVTFLMGAWLIAYAIWLRINHFPVTAGLQHMTDIALIAAIVVGAWLLLAVIRPSMLPQNRWAIGVVGLIIIILAEMQLSDDPSRHIYLKDFAKVIGVFLVIVGPMKLLIPKKVQQEMEDKNVEVIEV